MSSNAAASWDEEYRRGRYVDEPPVAFVEDIINSVRREGSSERVGLYLGCGNGRNYVPLVEAGLDLVGLDISATAIEQLRQRLPDRADRLLVGSVGDAPNDREFAVVIGIQVFQHGDRAATHALIKAAQQRTAINGLFCLRVNATQTDVWPAHQVADEGPDGDFTVMYTAGSKQGLAIHFFTDAELSALFANSFQPVLPLRLATRRRDQPAPGSWSQWEAIWRRVA